MDLTVPDATKVSAFYRAVAGWRKMSIPMGGYEDFCMMAPGKRKPAAGICHARGENVGLPAQWLIYINVADIRASVNACLAHGGEVIRAVRDQGMGKMAVIRDPAGAVAALFETAEPEPPKKKAKKNKR